MTWSRHAKRRSQQRAIDNTAVQAALNWGTVIRQYGGSRVFHLGKAEVRAARQLGLRLERHMGVAVVLSAEERVITVIRTRDRRRLSRTRKD